MSDITETETEAEAKTRQDVTRQGKTRQDDFAAYADAAARCCKIILRLRSINQATQLTEERTENTQTVREMGRHASEQLFMWLSDGSLLLRGKGLVLLFGSTILRGTFRFRRGRHAAGIIGEHWQHSDPDRTHGRRGAGRGVCVCRCHLL